jgi:hypothetical protein
LAWLKYWHAFFSTIAALIVLIVPWKVVVDGALQGSEPEPESRSEPEPKPESEPEPEPELELEPQKNDVTLWLHVIRPFMDGCMHSMAHFVKEWQQRLEEKGSKERGVWKNSPFKWKWRLFLGALVVLYGALPFFLWHEMVLPDIDDQDKKHERIVLLASIGLTAYGIGLVWYWSELQRQGVLIVRLHPQ